MSHEERLQAARAAIEQLFSDRSVPASTTLESLQALIDEIEIKCEALEYDIDQQEQ